MSEFAVPPISAFNFSSVFNSKIVDDAITVIDNLILNGRYLTTKPTFQTYDNLFQFKQFDLFEKTFNEACHYLIGSDVRSKNHSFCYCDFLSNWSLKIREEQWHNHKEVHLVGVMYLRFEDPSANPYSGTEFMHPEIGWTIPAEYTWHIFTGNLFHRPGIITTDQKRYVLTATKYLYE